ncbi:hypothetical protein [Mesorhizobium sp. L-8-3]|uniref:hypothetical protein n=1 Tax=Mesorhizobium sp. L-8-3 TaxID=2744522 RepID=UPI0019293C6E|nr:hypothetical protein [Mesorhizobium sp. L-8-3]BCH26110.1 hypothetical protein MesoLjLb_58950 [Mesorhizobium sp. L-8-3]
MDAATLDSAQVKAFLDAKPDLAGVLEGDGLQEVRYGVLADGRPYVLAIMSNGSGVLMKPHVRAPLRRVYASAGPVIEQT